MVVVNVGYFVAVRSKLCFVVVATSFCVEKFLLRKVERFLPEEHLEDTFFWLKVIFGLNEHSYSSLSTNLLYSSAILIFLIDSL